MSLVALHPLNVFGESILLFVVAILLLMRDRGSAMSSTAYDTLLGLLLMVFSFIRLIEFMGGARDGHVVTRAIFWFMWLIPVVIMSYLTYYHRRIDVSVLMAISLMALIAATIYIVSGGGAFNIISPDPSPGTSNGIYTWIRTDGAPLFLPVSFYMVLTAALIYLTAFSLRDKFYWALAVATTFGFLLGALFVPQVLKNPTGTLGSLATLVMLGVGVFAILLAPG